MPPSVRGNLCKTSTCPRVNTHRGLAASVLAEGRCVTHRDSDFLTEQLNHFCWAQPCRLRPSFEHLTSGEVFRREGGVAEIVVLVLRVHEKSELSEGLWP